VVVVSPSVTPRIASLAESGAIALHLRPFEPQDLAGVYLAYGATDDRAVNAEVAKLARTSGVLVNAVDDIPNCDFFAVAIVRRGDLQVAISTNGLSPAFARWMREYLEAQLPLEFADLLAVLGEVRQELKAQASIPEYEHWQRAIDEGVLARLRHGDREGARERIREVLLAAREQASLFQANDEPQASLFQAGGLPRAVETVATEPAPAGARRAGKPVPSH
jgi:precorrin-2 dehydrogenase/sirohydrochlorin ferrochelatase